MASQDSSNSLGMLEGANCDIEVAPSNRLHFRFPKSGGLYRGVRSEFRDRSDLVSFLAETFSLAPAGESVRGTVVRRNEYQRVDEYGRPVFTFGDPILDAITDNNGVLTLGKTRIDLFRPELGSPRERLGGISNVNLSTATNELRQKMLLDATAGTGEFSIVECTDEAIVLASTNPSQLDFFRDGGHLRFKAWNKNRVVYWTMGAEVDVKRGPDFTRARIDSRYLENVFGTFCTPVKFDSDEDTNDDYLDEYEWGLGAPQPTRVVSVCEVAWQGRVFSGQVEAGPQCFEFTG